MKTMLGRDVAASAGALSDTKRNIPTKRIIGLILQHGSKEAPAFFRFWRVENRFCFFEFQNPSFGKKGGAVGGQAGETHFVSNEDKIGALVVQLLDSIQHFGGHLGIE